MLGLQLRPVNTNATIHNALLRIDGMERPQPVPINLTIERLVAADVFSSFAMFRSRGFPSGGSMMDMASRRPLYPSHISCTAPHFTACFDNQLAGGERVEGVV